MKFSEAIKLKNGIFYNLEYHQSRVDKTMLDFGINATVNLSESLYPIPTGVENGLFKCRIVYSDMIESIEYIPYTFREIKTVKVVIDNDIDYSYKYANRERLTRLLQTSGCNDIIIIKNNLVTDASSSNLVFETHGELYTPDTCLLPGTKRQLLIDTGIITKRKIGVNEIQSFDKVHFINAMVDLEDNLVIETKNVIFSKPD